VEGHRLNRHELPVPRISLSQKRVKPLHAGTCLLSLVLLFCLAAWAQLAIPAPQPAAAQPEAPQDALGRTTPQGTVLRFLIAARKGDNDLAARYLNTRRAYSVPQLLDFIEKAGLTFGRWVRQAPYSIHCGVIAKIPQATRMAGLSLAEQYAAVELFRGTMARHSVVAYRNDNAGAPDQVSFAGNAWLAYVPIRMSDTICVQDRLPAGAAAVLINQTHTYRDLFLPIGSPEKTMFDAIDGIRSIADIVERTLSSLYRTTNIDMARTFFERLWWHDQVVFDSTQLSAVV